MRRGALLSFLLITASVPATAAPVAVTFEHPEAFTDATLFGGYGMKAEQPALDGISRYLESLGAKFLRPNQMLNVEVLNIDLAGQYEPWRAFATDVRFMRDTTPPRITLRYQLVEDGRTVVEGREALVDLNYLLNRGARKAQDPLAFEKALLAKWFQARIVERKLAPSA